MKMRSCTINMLLISIAAILQFAGCENIKFPSATWFDRGTEQDNYTVLIYVLSDPQTHILDARRYKETIEAQTGWRGLFAVNKAGHSELYWGKYPSIKAAQKNLKKAKAYQAPSGIKLFARAMAIPLPGKDVGPPEWKLTSAPGVYTVVIASFYNVPDKNIFGRRHFAVENCRQLRKEGFEAYYYHGQTRSFITVGTFGESSVEVIPESGKNRVEIRDQNVNTVLKEFPALAVNGYEQFVTAVDPKTGRPKRVRSKSYIIRIPRKKGTDARSDFNRTGHTQSW